MFKGIKVGDEVGVSTDSSSVPYNIQTVVKVYQHDIIVELEGFEDGVYDKATGVYVCPTATNKYIVPYNTALLANTMAQRSTLQSYLTSLTYEFEQQIDRVKAKFYGGDEPNIPRLKDLIKQLKEVM